METCLALPCCWPSFFPVFSRKARRSLQQPRHVTQVSPVHPWIPRAERRGSADEGPAKPAQPGAAATQRASAGPDPISMRPVLGRRAAGPVAPAHPLGPFRRVVALRSSGLISFMYVTFLLPAMTCPAVTTRVVSASPVASGRGLSHASSRELPPRRPSLTENLLIAVAYQRPHLHPPFRQASHPVAGPLRATAVSIPRPIDHSGSDGAIVAKKHFLKKKSLKKIPEPSHGNGSRDL